MQALCFLYHEVCNSPKDSGFQRKGALPYKHNIDKFYSDLKRITSYHPYSSLCEEDQKSSQLSLFMTFDDGGISALKAAEILEEQNWRGHFFIITSLINTTGFLTSSDIYSLHKKGHIIGSHSHNHPCPFRALSKNSQFEEWKISKDKLEDILNIEILSASVPGGDMNSYTVQSAYKAGFRHLFTSDPGINVKTYKDLNIYGRFCPKNYTSGEIVSRWAQGKGIKRIKLIRFFKDMLKRTFIFGIYNKLNTTPIK